MNTPTVTEIREALAAAIAPVMRSSAYMPESPQAPLAIVEGPEVDFNEDTLSDNYTFPVRIIVGTPNQRVASQKLDEAISRAGDGSIPRAIESDDTLGDIVQYALAIGVREYGTHVVQNVEYLGATLLVQVVAYRAMS